MRSSVSVAVILCVLALAVGFFAGRVSAPKSDSVRLEGREVTRGAAMQRDQVAVMRAPPAMAGVREWLALMEGMGSGDFSRMLADTLDNSQWAGGFPSFEVQVILRAWVDAAPADALRKVLAEGQDERYINLPGVVLAFWAESAPESAVEAFLTLPPEKRSGAWLYGLVSAVARSSPRLAMRLVDQAEPGRGGSSARVLLSALMDTDPELAADWINDMSEGSEKNQMLAHYFQQLSKEDPQSAAESVLQQLSGRMRSEQFGRLINTWGRDSFGEAAAFVGALDDAGLRSEGFDQLAWAAAGGAIPLEDAFAWIAENASGRAAAGAMQLLIRDLAQADPYRAALYVADLPLGRTYQNGLTTLASVWAGRDPVEAYRWLQEFPAGAERGRAFAAFSRGFAESSPEQAIRFLSEVGDPGERATLVRDVAAQIADDDPAAALRWADAIQDTNLRDEARRSAILAWTSQNPMAVGEYVLAQSDLNLSGSDLRRIGAAYALRDPAAAGRWTIALHGDYQAQVAEAVVREWVGTDAYAASEWVATLPEGAMRESAVENMVRMVMRFEPGSAFEWATTLRDEGSQRRWAMQAATVWGRSDPRAALAAVASSSLPTEDKERVARVIESGEITFGQHEWDGWRGRGRP